MARDFILLVLSDLERKESSVTQMFVYILIVPAFTFKGRLS